MKSVNEITEKISPVSEEETVIVESLENETAHHTSEEIENPNNEKGKMKIGTKSFWRFIERNFINILFSISLLIGYSEYSISQNDKKIEASLQLVSQWEDKGYYEDYHLIELKIESLRTEAYVGLQDQRDDLIADNQIINFVQNSLYSSLSNVEKRKFERLIYFYNKVGLCIKNKICDDNLLIEFFGHTASVIWLYFKPEIYLRRDNIPNYAVYAEFFSENSVSE